MTQAIYSFIIVAVILSARGLIQEKYPHRILTEIEKPQTQNSLKLQDMLTEDFGQNQFEGKWESPNNVKPLNFFNEVGGRSELVIYSYTIDQITKQLITDKYGTLVILLLDPTYRNQKAIRIALKLTGYEVGKTNTSWAGQQNIQVNTFEDHTFVNNHTLFATFSVIDLKQINIQADKLNLIITIQPLRQYKQLPFILLVPSLLMLIFIEICRKIDIPAQKLSLITISIIINFLMYISLLEVYRGIELQKYLVINGIITFGVVVRFTQTFQPAIRPINTIRGYMTFYCLSLIYFIGLFNYYYSRLFILLQGLWLVPQIVHNAVVGLKPGFYPSYIAMILVNQLYIIYYKGYSDNVFRQSPELLICGIIIILDILQITILYLQHIFGSRFFIPKFLRSNYYQYRRSSDSVDPQMNQDCPICLLPLKVQQATDYQLTTQPDTTVDIIKKYKVNFLQTPCNHKFHVMCLNHWMQHKLECPLDKKPLPPLQ